MSEPLYKVDPTQLVLIYALCEPSTGEIRYIGKSTSGLRRPYEHTRPSKYMEGHTHKNCWIRSLAAQGLRPKVLVVEVLPPDTSDEFLSRVESAWIGFLRGQGTRLTNGTDGGDGVRGYHHTEVAKAHMAQVMGEQARTPEGLAQRQEAWRRSRTPEARAKAQATWKVNKTAREARRAALQEQRELEREQRKALRRAVTAAADTERQELRFLRLAVRRKARVSLHKFELDSLLTGHRQDARLRMLARLRREALRALQP
jgi:hypothetical protein